MHIDDFDDLSELGEGTGRSFSPHFFAPSDLDSTHEELGSNTFEMDTLRARRSKLRARPPIDFHEARSTASEMSGSTLPPVPPTSNASSYLGKASSVGFRPKFSPEDIASLSVLDIYHNPHYRKLRQQYDHVSGVLASYLGRDLEANVTKSTLIPDIHQGTYSLFAFGHTLNKTHTPVPRRPESRTSSLGPSDSASQLTRSGIERESEHFLELVEAPSMRPSTFPASILWYYTDCVTDTSEGEIITKKNQSRPKMSIAIRRPDGSVISSPEFENIRHSAEVQRDNLIKLFRTDKRRRLPFADSSKLPTKSNIKKWFRAEYNQAILDLEAERKILRLCAGHWKADAMIGQAFLRLSEAENKIARAKATPSSMPDPSEPFDTMEPLDAMPAPVPQVPQVVSLSAAKRPLELSPGPKSPSVSHVQKRSKDNNVGRKAAPSNRESFFPPKFNPLTSSCTENPHPQGRSVARNLAPTFLKHSTVPEEPAPMNLDAASTVPSGASTVFFQLAHF
jgi:hypothetical protein